MPVLQFWTWQTSLQVRHKGQALCRADVIDVAGDWCASVLASHDWVIGADDQPLGDFIALSEAEGFTELECIVWTYYLPKEKDESEWDLFHVLLIKYSPD
jgi:hypothetical protein